MKKLKNEKVIGCDNIPLEALRLEVFHLDLCNRVWSRKQIPEENMSANQAGKERRSEPL